MSIDWSSKDTAHLKLILGSLLKHGGNAKTDREVRNRDRSIKNITEVLRSRGEKV